METNTSGGNKVSKRIRLVTRGSQRVMLGLREETNVQRTGRPQASLRHCLRIDETTSYRKDRVLRMTGASRLSKRNRRRRGPENKEHQFLRTESRTITTPWVLIRASPWISQAIRTGKIARRFLATRHMMRWGLRHWRQSTDS